MPLETFLFPLGIILLAFGGDRLVLGARDLSSKLEVPPFIIGIFILGFGTSLPELFVTIRALENGNSDIAIGGILGSNIANILLVLGVSLLLIKNKSIDVISSKDIFVMLFATSLFCYFIYSGSIKEGWSLAMILSLPVYLYLSYKFFNKKNTDFDYNNNSSNLIIFINLLIGFFFLIYGSKLFINGLIVISKFYGIQESVVGISLAAIGTSLPELSVTIAAFLRKEGSVALGNIVGSNIFNILGVLGLSTLLMGEINFSNEFTGINSIVLMASGIWILYIAINKPNNTKLFGYISLFSYVFYTIFIYF
jgi:cation:H+ antiporter